MSQPPASAVRRRPSAVLLALVGLAVVALVATAVLAIGPGSSSVADTAPPPDPRVAADAAAPSATVPPVPVPTDPPRQGGPAQRAGSVLVPQAPESIVLASGRVVPVRAVSTTPDGTLDVPDDIDKAGWWRGGSRLADPFGSTLIAAHIDSTTQGLGPFAELLQAEADDEVEVSSRGLTQTFVVKSLELVPRSTISELPTIFGASGGRRLVLVTCAPPYVAAQGGYQNIALVTAVAPAEPQRVSR